MILCEDYTSYRVCSNRELIDLPIRLLKKIEVSVPSLFSYENKVFIPDEDGRLACYDEIDFERNWVSDTGKLLPVYPLVSNESLFVVNYSDEKISRINLTDGKSIENLEFRYSSKWLACDEVLYARTYNRRNECKSSLKAIYLNSFDVKWEYSKLEFDDFSVSKSYMLLKSDSGVFFALDKNGDELWSHSMLMTPSLFSIDGIESHKNWDKGRTSFNTTFGSPIIYDDRIGVVPVFDNQLAGVEIRTGNILWLRKLSHSVSTRRVAYGDMLYCMGMGHIEIICLNTGDVEKIIEVDASLIYEKLNLRYIDFSLFTVAGSYIFAASENCNVFAAISLSSGAVEWFFEPENPIASTNAPYVSNGRVYYPCFRQLYVFEGSGGFISS